MPGGARGQAQAPAQPAHPVAHPARHPHPGHAGIVEGCVLGAAQPPVGGDVAGAVESGGHGQGHRRGQVVEVEELRGRIALEVGDPAGRVQGRGQPGVVVAGGDLAHHRGGPQHRRGRRRGGAAPLGDPALDLGPLDREGELRAGPQRRVLGQGQGVVGPRPVDGRGREHHEVADALRGRGVEHPTGGHHVIGAGARRSSSSPAPATEWSSTTDEAPARRGRRSAVRRSARREPSGAMRPGPPQATGTTASSPSSLRSRSTARRPSAESAPSTTTGPPLRSRRSASEGSSGAPAGPRRGSGAIGIRCRRASRIATSRVPRSPAGRSMSPSDPFGGMPFFGDLARMIGQQGPISWDAARQIAHSIATEGHPDVNVDPLARIQLEQLARVAELQVAHATGLGAIARRVRRDDRAGHPHPVGRPHPRRPQAALRAPGPLPRLGRHRPGPGTSTPGTMPGATAHPATGEPTDLDPFGQGDDDPTAAWLGQLMSMLQPMTLGMSAGSLVGHLATRAFGQYDLPVPRPPGDEVMILARRGRRLRGRVEPRGRRRAALGVPPRGRPPRRPRRPPRPG